MSQLASLITELLDGTDEEYARYRSLLLAQIVGFTAEQCDSWVALVEAQQEMDDASGVGAPTQLADLIGVFHPGTLKAMRDDLIEFLSESGSTGATVNALAAVESEIAVRLRRS